MRSWGLCLRLLLAVVAVTPVVTEDDWDYYEKGPSVWGQSYSTCLEDLQSPLNLNGDDAIITQTYDLQFLDYDISLRGNISNEGRTIGIHFYLNSKPKPRVVLSSPVVSGTFHLQKIDFYWPSQHWTDDVQYLLEMTLTHKDVSSNKTLTVSYLFSECVPTFRIGAFLPDEILEAVGRLKVAGSSSALELAPQTMLPSRQCGFFAYEGSLTEPPCTQGVTWLVRKEPLCSTWDQRQKFRDLNDAAGRPLRNTRPLQQRKNRPIYFLDC